MAIDREELREYLIPDNFIDESRIVNGIFKTRNFAEGVIMALAVALLANMIPTQSFETKVSVLVFACTPFFLLGIQGINGDTVSTFLRNALSWGKTKGIMLYNSQARALAQSPLDNMMEEEQLGDKVLDILDGIREKQRTRNGRHQLVEGQDFVFARDADLEGNYLDEQEVDTNVTDEAAAHRHLEEVPDGSDVDVVEMGKIETIFDDIQVSEDALDASALELDAQVDPKNKAKNNENTSLEFNDFEGELF